MVGSMNSILLIAPFKKLEETAREVVKSNDFKVDVVLGNLSEAVKIAKEAEEKGAEVIISRGGTYQAIKEEVKIPVVEINVNAFDILRAFKGLIGYKGPIGIVGYENVIFGIETLTEVLNLKLYKVVFTDEDKAPRQVYELASKGVKEFVGDTIGIKTVREMGLSGRLITSGKEAIISSINEAYRVLNIRRRERAKTKRFQIIMDFIHDGIIAVDSKGYITLMNKMATNIFGEDKKLIGKHVKEVIKNTKLIEVLKNGKPQLEELQKVGETVIATHRVPIIVDGKVEGAVATFQDVTKIQKLEQKIRRETYKKGLVAKYDFSDIVYKSCVMEDKIKQAQKYAALDSTVLILGETGTGKELFAHSIHNFSSRKKGPFVAINCAALPENLLESELFGYAEGAFTGARKGGKPGLFELAHTGTIFLDEIGDMPLNLPSRLLRVIQEKEVMRIGDDRVIPVDVRIIASTNKKLQQDIKEKKFRKDLYYRLNILTLKLPPLRQRIEDIPVLTDYFIDLYSKKMNKKIRGITQEAKNLLINYEYKGNVRELKSIIERIVAFIEEEYIDVKHLKTMGKEEEEGKNVIKTNLISDEISTLKTLKEIEVMAIRSALKQTNNNVSKAARLLGINRTTIWRKLKNM
ncbi:MAG: hypothetical protein PWP21_1159 [Thermosediminibacterales bacterium]|nr:hypothetical protein [Thermosediminibacterales bacterium]